MAPRSPDGSAHAVAWAFVSLPVDEPPATMQSAVMVDCRWPPVEEVRAVWAACGPVGADAEVRAWVESRALSPEGIDRCGVAGALPPGLDLPRWARNGGRPWNVIGYRLLVPMFDAAGELRSFRARSIVERDGVPRALPPFDYPTSGLIMADGVGIAMLRDGRWPNGAENRVLVTVAESNWLTWCDRGLDRGHYAVLGLGRNDEWTQELADRIPDGSTVIIRTDRDDAGDRYAEDIAATLGARCRILEADAEKRAKRRAERARLEFMRSMN